jgi:hypothetical protein
MEVRLLRWVGVLRFLLVAEVAAEEQEELRWGEAAAAAEGRRLLGQVVRVVEVEVEVEVEVLR